MEPVPAAWSASGPRRWRQIVVLVFGSALAPLEFFDEELHEAGYGSSGDSFACDLTLVGFEMLVVPLTERNTQRHIGWRERYLGQQQAVSPTTEAQSARRVVA